MHRWFFLFLLACLPLTGVAATPDAAAILQVRYPTSDSHADPRNAYFIALLTLALEETRRDHGDFRLQPVYDLTTQDRVISQLASGKDVDVLWTMTTREREQQLLPVRIPLLKGLMGLRWLVIRQQDARRFARIGSLAGLRSLTAGQGHDWPDRTILEANGFKVATSVTYDSLFAMLESGRFDFLPRGFNEPFTELAARPQLALMVAPRLLLFYPAAEYFFVNRQNAALAERLETGLWRAIHDGSFERLFRHFPGNAEALAHLTQQPLRIIRLDNPLLPEATPLAQKELWFTLPAGTRYLP